ncbi:putative cell cycle control protein Cwf15 [Aspergillus nomiae NRRL 13137]|uniref:Putative cell cycle control protein Cwf15 n=1 Tax=Aspergillus nomiae NRRL (strain ATCC 15546 / NRRL 13137 / CBS 260.88 / M93) TaxID=1509407 RepID=A0A0L1IT75_ASPN3|nr:putative cell cycle control protein Cwf15 [Aspergillus nomiae NRRL 13137]KNG82697.1 putative cell cycle control protein Cwf15 [Aspergillus nomiae NRRL 13137]
MTTAHRPTFDPAQGKEALRGPAYHQRLLPAHTHLKTRQLGQGGEGEAQQRDLRAELLQAEAAHFAKKRGIPVDEPTVDNTAPKRQIEDGPSGGDPVGTEDEDPEAKRRRILEETRDIDADSDGSEDDSSEEESDDEEDEAAELMRELEKIKKERQEQKEKEERERAAEEEEKREYDIAKGNPLLNAQDFNLKRRWDDDVVFKNQAGEPKIREEKSLSTCLFPAQLPAIVQSQTPFTANTHGNFKHYYTFMSNGNVIMDRINTNISQLLQRFENIMATATVESTSHTSTAVETYQLDVESTALVRAAEDILSLTRTMKETWLFGKLNTLGEDESDVKRREELERDADAIQKAIEEGGLLKPAK